MTQLSERIQDFDSCEFFRMPVFSSESKTSTCDSYLCGICEFENKNGCTVYINKVGHC